MIGMNATVRVLSSSHSASRLFSYLSLLLFQLQMGMMGDFVDKLHDSTKVMSEEQQQSMNVALSLANGRRSSVAGGEGLPSAGGEGLSGALATELREAMRSMHEDVKLLREQMFMEIGKLKSSEPKGPA